VSSLKYLPRVLAYVRPYWALALLTGVMILISAAVALLVPWPLKIIIDSVLGSQPVPWLFRWIGGHKYPLLIAVVLAGFFVVFLENLASVLHNYLATKLDQRMTLDFRGDLLRHVERMSLAFHDQKRSGMLIYIINSQAGAAAGLIMTIPPLVQSALTLVGMLVIWIALDWRLALVSLTVVPFLYYSVGYYAKHIQPRLANVMGLEGESLAIIHESMSMMKVIAAFGREDYEFNRFRKQG
jgi:ATP-binding cassette subfamily B protein